MGCIRREGGKVKGVSIGIRNSDGKVNNTEKIGTATTKSSVCSVKVLDLFLWCPILVLALSILGLGGRALALLLDSLGWRWLVFFFLLLSFFFPLSLVLWTIHCKWEP
jgi:hypothetical protein